MHLLSVEDFQQKGLAKGEKPVTFTMGLRIYLMRGSNLAARQAALMPAERRRFSIASFILEWTHVNQGGNKDFSAALL